MVLINGYLLPLPSQPESWLAIYPFPTYYISSWGRVKNLRGKILKLDTDKAGYSRIKLRRKNLKIHRLVANHFLGWDSKDVNHKDGNKKNNTVENLEYLTKSANGKHARDHGLHIGRKLCAEIVKEIKANPNLPLSLASAKYGVSTRCIQHIRAGTTWCHVSAV